MGQWNQWEEIWPKSSIKIIDGYFEKIFFIFVWILRLEFNEELTEKVQDEARFYVDFDSQEFLSSSLVEGVTVTIVIRYLYFHVVPKRWEECINNRRKESEQKDEIFEALVFQIIGLYR